MVLFIVCQLTKLWIKVGPSILNLNILKNENICELEAGVNRFSKLQILTQQICMLAQMHL